MTLVRRLRRIPLWAVAAALLIPGALAAFILADLGIFELPFSRPVYPSGWQPMRFDMKIWAKANGDVGVMGWGQDPLRENRRARMVDDLLAHHLHKGMTKTEVEKLMGRYDAGGDGDGWVSLYGLMFLPSPDQKAYARMRWGTSDPILVIEYKGPDLRLVSAKVEKWGE